MSKCELSVRNVTSLLYYDRSRYHRWQLITICHIFLCSETSEDGATGITDLLISKCSRKHSLRSAIPSILIGGLDYASIQLHTSSVVADPYIIPPASRMTS